MSHIYGWNGLTAVFFSINAMARTDSVIRHRVQYVQWLHLAYTQISLFLSSI